eukprot:jgi/Tetstr1/425864/TSEL_016240.t2
MPHSNPEDDGGLDATPDTKPCRFNNPGEILHQLGSSSSGTSCRSNAQDMIARKRPSDTQCCVSFPLALILTLSRLPGALSRPAWRPQHGQEEIWSPEAVIESENFCAVQDYGAACDSLTDDTDSIQDAITACAYSGAVHFPAGQVCISLPLELLSGTTLYLPDNATLRAGSRLMWQVNGRQFNFFDNVTLLNSPAMALVLWGPCSQNRSG